MSATPKDTWKQGKITIDIPHMLTLLADSLYPSPAVAVRELLANATDAVIKKKALIQRNPDLDDRLPPRVEVHWDPHHQRLRIEDNGCGIRPDEIETCLGTIGVSGTRMFRDQDYERNLVKQLIGTFGIGMLASFKLGENLVVKTRAIDVPGNTGIEWQAKRGEPAYRMREVVMNRTGTSVEVEASSLNREVDENIYKWVIRYGDLLPVPIYDNFQNLLNSYGKVPWEGAPGWEGNVPDLERFITERGKVNRPLWMVPVLPHEIDVRGVLYIPDDPNFLNADGGVDLYVKRMLVRRGCPGILPEEMSFYTGVIDCWDLRMSMSREDPMRDSTFERLREYLREQALRGLANLAAQPNRFDLVQGRYNRTLKAAAATDEAIFAAIGEAFSFYIGPSRKKTLREYTASMASREDPTTQNKIYYVPATGTLLGRYQVDQVLAKKKLEALEIAQPPPDRDGSQDKGIDLILLEKYAAKKKLEVIRADSAAGIFDKRAEEKKWRLVEAVFGHLLAGRSPTITTSPFDPSDLPLLLRAPDPQADQLRIRQIEEALRQTRLEHPDSPVANQFELLVELAKQQVDRESRRIDVIVNALNPLMCQFADLLERGNVLGGDEALILASEVYNLALQYNGFVVDPHNMSRALINRTELLSRYLNKADILATMGGGPTAEEDSAPAPVQ